MQAQIRMQRPPTDRLRGKLVRGAVA